MSEIPLTKRSKDERLAIAASLLSSIWQEVRVSEDEADTRLLQAAVNAQVDIDRIVWKLNVLNGAYPKEKSDGADASI